MKTIICCFLPSLLSISSTAAETAAAEPARQPFFAFRNGVDLPPAETAALLKELGYDGLSASGHDVAPLLRELGARGLKLYNTYLTPTFDAATNALTEPVRQLIDELQGTGAALWIAPQHVTRVASPPDRRTG